MRNRSQYSTSNERSMLKLPLPLFRKDILSGIADVLLVYSILSPVILGIVGYYVKLTPNFIRTFIVLEGPALISFFIYAMLYGTEVFKENRTIILTVLILTCAVFLSTSRQFDTSLARNSLKFFIGYCLFGFFLGTISRMSLSRSRRFQTIWMVCIVLSVLYAIYSIQDVGYTFGRFTLAGHNPAKIGALNYFFALCSLSYFAVAKRVAFKIVSGVICILCVFFAFSSGSRAALLAFLVTFVLYMPYPIIVNRSRVQKLSYFAALIVIGALVSLIWLGTGNNRVKNRYLSIVKFPEQAFAYLCNNDKSSYRAVNRFAVWRDAVSKFKQNPISGSGFATTYYHEVRKKNRVHPHNILLEFLAETGLIGFSAFILFLVLVVKRAIKNYLLLGDNEHRLAYIFYPLSFAFFFIFSCSHFAIHENYLLWYFAGMIVGFDTQTQQHSSS